MCKFKYLEPKTLKQLKPQNQNLNLYSKKNIFFKSSI